MEQRKRRHEEMFSALTDEEKERLLTLLETISQDWEERYPEGRVRRACSCGQDGNR